MIHIIDDLWLDADKYCYIIKKQSEIQKGDRAGEVIYTELAYPATYERVFSWLIDNEFKQGINHGLHVMKKRCDHLKEHLTQLYESGNIPIRRDKVESY